MEAGQGGSMPESLNVVSAAIAPAAPIPRHRGRLHAKVAVLVVPALPKPLVFPWFPA